MANYPQRMFDAVADLQTLTSVEGVTNKLGHVLSSFGYNAFLVTSVPEPPLRLEPYILLNGWPQGWTEHYGKYDYYAHDPVAAWCRKAIDPFEWREAPYNEETNPKAAEVMDVARDFGMNEGYLVPIVRSTGFQACVTMAGSHPDLDPMAKRVIHVVSIMAHGRISALKGESINQKQILTAREREVLHWVSVGKTSWEISTILHLSKSTIDIMVNRAQQKLNAVTRTQAVVNALRAGEINF